jgi:arylsulfatase A-like enzyme
VNAVIDRIRSMTSRSLLLLAGLLATAAAFGASAAHAAPPNVVLILGDDIAWTDYGFMGHETIRTPHLDRLAKESLVFTRGYVPASLCRPSLMSLITGLYPHQHLVTGNDPPRGTPRDRMLTQIDRLPTVPKLLAEQGYASLQSGKWWEGNFARGGFTHGMTHGDTTRGGRHGDDGLKIGRQGLDPIRKFLDEHSERPFFIWYAPMLPHQPHNPPPRLLEKYADQQSPHVAKYFAMVEWFDETCGELLDELDRRKLSDNTLVIYLADNGWIQDPERPAFDARSKRSQFDGGLRTPLMLRWPGKIEPRRDQEQLVSSLDFMPTVLHACGAKVPKGLPGVSLLPVALSNKPLEREAIFGAIFEHDIPDLARASPGLQHRWMIRGEWKLIVPARDQDSAELYHIVDDPHEEQNVAARHSETIAGLRRELDAWWDGE